MFLYIIAGFEGLYLDHWSITHGKSSKSVAASLLANGNITHTLLVVLSYAILMMLGRASYSQFVGPCSTPISSPSRMGIFPSMSRLPANLPKILVDVIYSDGRDAQPAASTSGSRAAPAAPSKAEAKDTNQSQSDRKVDRAMIGGREGGGEPTGPPCMALSTDALTYFVYTKIILISPIC